MIICNDIFFGYGDIFIQADKETRSLVFKELEVARECGTYLEPHKAKFTDNELRLDNMTWEDCEKFAEYLEYIEYGSRWFKFRDINFDFQIFNECSLKALWANLNVIHDSF